ncbi:28S ribosomal mitochondrial-like isoform X2 [Labeo rohita]|uniref:Small ribosomal subunit protein mS40 n=1 Tax=Labeo rohita TaxID=84645 RepID=A0A498MGC4_LABRO|nr:28S ribosomal mitochondrial-like isoform X2 [Labeo rohita]RXN20298.1 28S ribosomal mitochondrial-like isoform X2 [Labeo rohita]
MAASLQRIGIVICRTFPVILQRNIQTQSIKLMRMIVLSQRGDKICGNPCPICRDPNIIVHYKNVNLLQQFISPQTGIVYDPTRTGVCMKQQKLLNKAIETARDCGLLSAQLPHVDYSKEDYSNTHGAVAPTPAPFSLSSGELWYPWYGSIKPDERELARVKRIYKDYLKSDV